MNRQDRFKVALMARGSRFVKHTFRFVVLSRLAGGFYYIGKAGALRYGPNVKNSVPVSDKFKAILLESTPPA